MKHTDFWRLKCRDCGSCDIDVNSDDKKTVTIKCNECGYSKKINSKPCSLLNLNGGINRVDIYEFNTGEKPTGEQLEIINKFEKSVLNFLQQNYSPESGCLWHRDRLFAYLSGSLRYAAEQSEGKVEYIEEEKVLK